jgi:hypothetical protein
MSGFALKPLILVGTSLRECAKINGHRDSGFGRN